MSELTEPELAKWEADINREIEEYLKKRREEELKRGIPSAKVPASQSVQ